MAKVITLLTSIAAALGAIVAQIQGGGISGDNGGVIGPPAVSTVSASFTEDSSSFIGNRGMGLQTRQMTLSQETNPNAWPSRSAQYRIQWEELEPTDNNFSCTTLRSFIIRAAGEGQSTNLRVYENDFPSGFGCPSYVTTHSGYTVTYEGNSDQVCDWENTSVRAEHLEMVAGLYNCISDLLPYIDGIDTGWGMYNEINYSGTDITAVLGAGTGGGTVGNPVPGLTATAYQALYSNWLTYFDGSILIGFTDEQNNYDYTTGTLGWSARGDGWGYRDGSGTTNCPAAGVQMCTIYPATIADGSTDWQTSRRYAESYSSLSGWGSYAYSSSFSWLLDNHFSVVDTRNYFNPGIAGIETAIENTLPTLGYRQYLRQVVWPSGSLAAGSNYPFSLYFRNQGVAPDLMNHWAAVKLVDQAGKGQQTCLAATPANWLPYSVDGEETVSISCSLSASLPSGTYDVLVGIANSTGEADVNLAVTASPTNYWYDAGDVTVTSGTSTSQFNQGDFEEASDQYLTIADNTALSLEGGDFTLAAGFNAESFRAGAGGHVIMGKGDIGATGQEYNLYQFDNAGTKVLRGRISTGTNQSVDSTVALSTSTDYCVTFSFNNTSKEMKICVNGSCNTSTASGSMSAKANAFRIGGDTIVTDRTWDGTINNPAVWKGRVLSDAQRSTVCSGNKMMRYDEMPADIRAGLVAFWTFDSTLTADSVGSNTLTNTNGVTQVTATEP